LSEITDDMSRTGAPDGVLKNLTKTKSLQDKFSFRKIENMF